MVQETKSCKICGKLFQQIGFSDTCLDCMEQDEKDFQRIREYIHEHGRPSIFEVASNLDMTMSKIKKYLREGRLEIVEKINSFLDCEICGKPIQSGKYCDDCFKQVNHDFKSIYAGKAGTGSNAKLNFLSGSDYNKSKKAKSVI